MFHRCQSIAARATARDCSRASSLVVFVMRSGTSQHRAVGLRHGYFWESGPNLSGFRRLPGSPRPRQVMVVGFETLAFEVLSRLQKLTVVKRGEGTVD